MAFSDLADSDQGPAEAGASSLDVSVTVSGKSPSVAGQLPEGLTLRGYLKLCGL